VCGAQEGICRRNIYFSIPLLIFFIKPKTYQPPFVLTASYNKPQKNINSTVYPLSVLRTCVVSRTTVLKTSDPPCKSYAEQEWGGGRYLCFLRIINDRGTSTLLIAYEFVIRSKCTSRVTCIYKACARYPTGPDPCRPCQCYYPGATLCRHVPL
jgi:hypothetical protein